MDYKIIGTTMPVVECTLNAGEKLQCQVGAMKYMDYGMDMKTGSAGGVGGFIKRKLAGESGFLNIYTATANGQRVAFGHTFPGNIFAFNISQTSIICQRRSFLASEPSVDLQIAFQKKLGAGFFGGEGFIMQKLTGSGMALVELDGEVIELDLKQGEKIKVETGAVGMYESTVNMDIEMVKGLGNMFFGGEGLFLTTLTGPGKVWLQTMSIQSMAQELYPFLPTSKK
jgi:uncharacterized protein (TIGR00266 family)